MVLRSILDLPDVYQSLPAHAKERFDSLYSFSLDTGVLKVPSSMRDWAVKQFGSVHAVEHQPILKVTNKWTFEGALFNKLRADRPIHAGAPVDKEELLAMAAKEPFADVFGRTPEDSFGRVQGPFEVTASNVAKYDAVHGLVVFQRADPLAFTEEETVSHFRTAMSWIGKANLADVTAKYPVIGWNCLWKAGASLVHGHMQVLVGKHEPYATMQLYKLRSEEYAREYGLSYWDAVYAVHKDLGLGAARGDVKVFAHLTPRKEKEVVLFAAASDDSLFRITHKVLKVLTTALGVESFNVVVTLPPLDGSWKGVPVIVRIVDRGALASKTTDIGIAELYLGQNVVAADPVKVWDAMKKSI